MILFGQNFSERPDADLVEGIMMKKDINEDGLFFTEIIHPNKIDVKEDSTTKEVEAKIYDINWVYKLIDSHEKTNFLKFICELA